MDNSIYYNEEGILNKSLLIWIKSQNLTFKDSILYLLKNHLKQKEEIDYYTTNIDQSISDWNVFLDNTGMRLSHNQKSLNSNYFNLKDIYNITIIEAKNKNII